MLTPILINIISYILTSPLFMINYKDLKKNDRIKSNQIGVPITGKLMESPKQGKGLKKVILIWTNGSDYFMFN